MKVQHNNVQYTIGWSYDNHNSPIKTKCYIKQGEEVLAEAEVTKHVHDAQCKEAARRFSLKAALKNMKADKELSHVFRLSFRARTKQGYEDMLAKNQINVL